MSNWTGSLGKLCELVSPSLLTGDLKDLCQHPEEHVLTDHSIKHRPSTIYGKFYSFVFIV